MLSFGLVCRANWDALHSRFAMPIRPPALTPSRVRLGAIGLAVAAAYIAAAHVGFRVAFVAEQVSTVWAPTGIAQAALILWGRALWPA